MRSDRQLALGYAVSVVSLLLIVGGVLMTHGLRQRFSPAVLASADIAGDHGPTHRLSFEKLAPGAPIFTTIGTAGIEPHWLIFGDSHVPALETAFDNWLKQRGEAALIGYQQACTPIIATDNTSCRAFLSATMDYLRQHPKIGRVFIVSIWLRPHLPGYTDPEGHAIEGEPAIAVAKTQLHKTLVTLNNMGLETVVWQPVPVMPAKVPQTAARNLVFGHYRSVDQPLTTYIETNSWLRETLKDDNRLIRATVDPSRYLCRDGICCGIVGGRPLYSDDQHPAYSQSEVFTRMLQGDLSHLPLAKGRDWALSGQGKVHKLYE